MFSSCQMAENLAMLNMVILVDAFARHDWLLRAVNKRLREELAKVQVEVNEEKSRVVDLAKGESFGFLGFDFRRVRSLGGVWRPHYTPHLKKQTELLGKLKEIFRRFQQVRGRSCRNCFTHSSYKS